MNNLIIGLLLAIPLPVNAQASEVPLVTINLEQKVEQTFNDKRMIDVLKCESSLNQFVNGKPLISPTSDVGIAQINQVHWQRAKELGLDIFSSLDDNLKMARIIYDEEGIKAWVCFKS